MHTSHFLGYICNCLKHLIPHVHSVNLEPSTIANFLILGELQSDGSNLELCSLTHSPPTA
jgi:hypothetical protein